MLPSEMRYIGEKILDEYIVSKANMNENNEQSSSKPTKSRLKTKTFWFLFLLITSLVLLRIDIGLREMGDPIDYLGILSSHGTQQKTIALAFILLFVCPYGGFCMAWLIYDALKSYKERYGKKFK